MDDFDLELFRAGFAAEVHGEALAVAADSDNAVLDPIGALVFS